jgi:hypothetical protein
LLINESKVKEVINKYFHRIINRRISLNENINELIYFINERNCFFNNKFDLYKLYEYIDNKEKMNFSLKVKDQKIRKHNKKKKEKMNIEKNTGFINSNKEVQNRSKIIPQREELILINGNKEKKDKNTNSKEHNKNKIIINKSESSNNSNIENNSHKNNKDKNFIKNEKNSF